MDAGTPVARDRDATAAASAKLQPQLGKAAIKESNGDPISEQLKQQISNSNLDSGVGIDGAPVATSNTWEAKRTRYGCCPRRCGSIQYFLVCFLICGCFAAAAIALFSDMGVGKDSLEFLEEREDWSWPCFFVALAIFLVLWLFDYFSPPHHPGKHFLLFQGDRVVGHSLLAGSIIFMMASFLLYVKEYPFNPVMITVFMCPVALASARKLLKPVDRVSHALGHGVISKGALRAGEVLVAVTSEEEDQRRFYRAALASLVLTSVCSIALWLAWALQKGQGLDHKLEESSHRDQEVVYILWATPLIVAIVFVVFALMVFLRVLFDRQYNDSDHIRTWALNRGQTISLALVDFVDQDTRHPDKAEHVEFAVRRSIAAAVSDERQAARLMQLSKILKFIGCAILFKLGAVYVTFQLVAAGSHIALMVQGFLGAMFLLFLSFVHLSFKRLWDVLSSWLLELPLWRKALHIAQTNLVKSCVLGILLPGVPFFLLLSMLTQCVRRCRGFSNLQELERRTSASSTSGEDSCPQPSRSTSGSQRSFIFTARVHRGIDVMMKWDWIGIIWWLYFWALLYVALTVSQRLLNVFLAFMKDALSDTAFILVCLCMFGIGLGLFLIPVVPGAPIFFFSGALLPDKCEAGFWWGALVSIVLGWFLKLTACAMQQKCFGGVLGHYLYIRQQVGTHKPLLRTIEVVLRKPGLSLGKVAILCGGPDWPTSVLAGILRCSLPQMLLGTTPIVFFVGPFALSGTFYLKRSESEVWDRSANLMFTVTGIVCVILYAIMAWAVETEYERSNHMVTCSRREDIELEWRDHCQFVIRSRCNTTWDNIPRCVLVFYAAGAIGVVLTGHLFWWNVTSCFGDFQPTSKMSDLEWYGDDELSIIKFLGLVGLIVAAVSCSGLGMFRIWRWLSMRQTVQECITELAKSEESWKKQRLHLCDLPAISSTPSMHASEAAMDVRTEPQAQDDGIMDRVRVEASAIDAMDVCTEPQAKDDGMMDSVRVEASAMDVPNAPNIIPSQELCVKSVDADAAADPQTMGQYKTAIDDSGAASLPNEEVKSLDADAAADPETMGQYKTAIDDSGAASLPNMVSAPKENLSEGEGQGRLPPNP